MTTIGRIEPFEEQEGTWDQYQERLEQYFIANDVTDAKRVPVTLSLIGGKTYASVRPPNRPRRLSLNSVRSCLSTCAQSLSSLPNDIDSSKDSKR